MKVFLIGSFNAEILARQLQYYKVEAQAGQPSKFLGASFLRGLDVIYNVYFTRSLVLALSSKSLRKKFIVHFVGSDAFDYAAQRGFEKAISNFVLGMCDRVLYVTEELRHVARLKKGEVIPIPIDTKMFRQQEYNGEKRDILYYCPYPHEIYRVDWIVEYAKLHPEKTITVLGYDHSLDLPNVKVVPFVAYHQMPQVYNTHRCLIRMTTEDGYPKMPYEALLCGLEVFWNGQKITKVPNEMLMENTIPKLIAILESLK